MAIKRFFSDIWFMLKSLRNIWKIQRIMSKEHARLKKMSEEIGPIGMFLYQFEEVPIDDPNHDVIKQIMLTEFIEVLEYIDEEDIIQEDLETFYKYCRMHGIDVQVG